MFVMHRNSSTPFILVAPVITSAPLLLKLHNEICEVSDSGVGSFLTFKIEAFVLFYLGSYHRRGRPRGWSWLSTIPVPLIDLAKMFVLDAHSGLQYCQSTLAYFWQVRRLEVLYICVYRSIWLSTPFYLQLSTLSPKSWFIMDTHSSCFLLHFSLELLFVFWKTLVILFLWFRVQTLSASSI